MAEAFTYQPVKSRRFTCGEKDGYTNLMVVKLFGPAGARACAYSCNMNIDMDGEPQAYGPMFDPAIKPIDSLGDAGWISEDVNKARKAVFEAAKKHLEELEKKKLDLAAKAKPAPAGTKPAPDAAAAALDKEIADAKTAVRKAARYSDEPGKKPPHYGEIFWDWYGLISLTPDDKEKKAHHETIAELDGYKIKLKKVLRRPVLDDKKPYLKDVYGRYPVIQSAYEPGPGYYVSAFPRVVNPLYPDWDQRSYLPVGSTTQVPNAALSVPLENVTGVHLKDIVLAIRLDTGTTGAFPFLDRGFKPKVAECSIGAFTAMGGVVASRVNASKNDFLLLYLAFANSAGQTPADTLQKFASAANAEEFPVLLAFIAQATSDTKKNSRDAMKTVSGDPVKNFEKWKKLRASSSGVLPECFDVINQGLRDAGFIPLAQRVLRKHPSLAGSGPWLQPPTKPW
jgi:hypothetical protein